MWHYREHFFPDTDADPVTMGEGGTPLVDGAKTAAMLGIARVSFKLESANPTGSYKDRFASAAVTHMVSRNVTHCLATSSGNTGAALAAYCARANIDCRIAIVEGTPDGKLVQMLAYGATLARIVGFGIDPAVTTDVFEELQSHCQAGEAALQISAFTYSAEGMSGVKSLAFELTDAGESFDHVFTPAGGGGLTLATCRGFAQWKELGKIDRVPKVHVVQPAGNATIAGPLREGKDKGQAVTCTSNVSGLQVANVIDGDMVIPAVRDTGGHGFLVEDETVFKWQAHLSQVEGIFAEPAGSTALAGLAAAVEEGRIGKNDHAVCLVTGSGFKDPKSIAAFAKPESVQTLAVADWQTAWWGG